MAGTIEKITIVIDGSSEDAGKVRKRPCDPPSPYKESIAREAAIRNGSKRRARSTKRR